MSGTRLVRAELWKLPLIVVLTMGGAGASEAFAQNVQPKAENFNKEKFQPRAENCGREKCPQPPPAPKPPPSGGGPVPGPPGPPSQKAQ
jgi:hypothetical protein